MKPKEKSLDNVNCDYYYLRMNGVCAKTALRMVGIAYKDNYLRKQ